MYPPSTPVTSARDARSGRIRNESARTFAAGFFDVASQTRKGAGRSFRFIESCSRLAWRRAWGSAQPTPAWRWVALLYVVIALAAPLLMYVGPDVMSPAAPVIADGALDGDLSLHLRQTPGSDRLLAGPAR